MIVIFREEKYEKLYSICGRLDEHEKIKYPFDVGADPITDKKQGSNKDFIVLQNRSR